MDKNLHNIDDIFKKAYQQYDEEPSEAVWEKLNAQLDKEAAQKYKKRFIGWKRVAILLLFLLSGLVIYESRNLIKKEKKEELAGKNNLPVSDKPGAGSEGISDSGHIPGHPGKSSGSMGSPQSFAPQKKLADLLKSALKGNTITNSQNELGLLKFNRKNDSTNHQLLWPDKIIPAVKERIMVANEHAKVNGYEKFQFKKPEIIDNILMADINSREARRKRETGIASYEKTDSSMSALISPNPSKITGGLISDVRPAGSISVNKKTGAATNFTPYWTLMSFGSGEWGQYQLDNGVQDNTSPQDEKEEINKREKHQISFSGGLLATRQFTKHLGIKTGIIYSNTAISINPQEMYAAKQPDGVVAYKYITSSGYGYVKPTFGSAPALGDSLQSAYAQHNLQSLTIPLQLSYQFTKRKFSLTPSAGVSINFITRATVQAEVKNALNREIVTLNGLNGMRNIYAGLIADLNLQYHYNNRWAFNIFPSFKYAITPITKNNVVKTYPYSMGVSAGITYKFLK